jgi:hypothetical protein
MSDEPRRAESKHGSRSRSRRPTVPRNADAIATELLGAPYVSLLEQCTCERYAVVKREYERLLPATLAG